MFRQCLNFLVNLIARLTNRHATNSTGKITAKYTAHALSTPGYTRKVGTERKYVSEVYLKLRDHGCYYAIGRDNEDFQFWFPHNALRFGNWRISVMSICNGGGSDDISDILSADFYDQAGNEIYGKSISLDDPTEDLDIILREDFFKRPCATFVPIPTTAPASATTD